MTLQELFQEIKPLNQQAMASCRARWMSIAAPLHGMGKLENALIQIAGIQQTAEIHLQKKALITMCADNGVVEEGVSQTGQEVTKIVSDNFARGISSSAILCRYSHCDFYPIDIGVAQDTLAINRKVRYGSRNFAKEEALTQEEVLKAIWVGIDLAKELKEKGYDIIATGEMGIGNTTTASAIVSVLLNEPVEKMTGRGAGLSDKALKKKISVIKEAIAFHQPDRENALDVLSKVGGLDIAGLTGVFLGGAFYQIPIVIDGFISGAAAVCAAWLCPKVCHYMLASHVSKEPASQKMLEVIGLDPLIYADLCLGEGTGALMLFPMLDMAGEIYGKMASFTEIQVEQYQEYS